MTAGQSDPRKKKKKKLIHWGGCPLYPVDDLLDLLQSFFHEVSPSLRPDTTWPSCWGGLLWYPLLAFRSLESPLRVPNPWLCSALAKCCKKREQALGQYLWLLWTYRMKEVHDYIPADPFRYQRRFRPASLVGPLQTYLASL